MTRQHSQFSYQFASMILDSQAIVVFADSVKSMKPEYPETRGLGMS